MIRRSITDNGGPCVDCIARAMCIHKLWGRLITMCKPFTKHIISTSGIDDIVFPVEIQYYYQPLNKHYSLSKGSDNKVYIGSGDLRYGRKTS